MSAVLKAYLLGVLRRADWYIFTDVSRAFSAFIFSAFFLVIHRVLIDAKFRTTRLFEDHLEDPGENGKIILSGRFTPGKDPVPIV